MSPRIVLSLGSLFFGFALAQGQLPTAAVTIPTPQTAVATFYPAITPLTIVKRVDEVNLLLSVTNRRGHFVENLNPSDLVITDDGQPPSKITYFQRQTDLPLRVALVVDVSDSERYHLPAEQKAVQWFLKKIVRPERDLAMIVSFNHEASMVQAPTSDTAKLRAGVRKMRTGGETSVFDAVAFAADQLRSISDTEPTRRVIVLVTDGADNRSKLGMEEAVEHALRAESVVYVVDTKETVFDDQERRADHVTKYIADATGGRTFSCNDVSNSFRAIQKELRSQYAVSYRPNNLLNGLFRTVRVLGPKGIRIRHRAGYYSR